MLTRLFIERADAMYLALPDGKISRQCSGRTHIELSELAAASLGRWLRAIQPGKAGSQSEIFVSGHSTLVPAAVAVPTMAYSTQLETHTGHFRPRRLDFFGARPCAL
ncbi:MAG TPA: hypothetical protein EYN91_15995 [Candidatus Melainabacteria bacterium]|nr:hypothetical protein [Candidatus Melainabacteria bacterium]HIN63739.1 hypothetical protein [Candidatus Obscuribacterales bacterium]